MQDAPIRRALAVFGLLILGGSGIALYVSRRPTPPPVIITPPPQASPASSTNAASPLAPNSGGTRRQPHTPAPLIYVHVAGAVKRPSLYALAPGTRIMQAIKSAGGPASKADLDAINLAERVKDGEKVYVPVKQPQAAMADPPGNVIGHAGDIPDDTVTPTLDTTTPGTAGETVATPKPVRTARHGGMGRSDKLTSPTQGRINLNTANAGQLQRLPGIGPAMAARILSYRAQAHGFQKIEELQEVGGIGPKKFAKIAPLVSLN